MCHTELCALARTRAHWARWPLLGLPQSTLVVERRMAGSVRSAARHSPKQASPERGCNIVVSPPPRSVLLLLPLRRLPPRPLLSCRPLAFLGLPPGIVGQLAQAFHNLSSGGPPRWVLVDALQLQVRHRLQWGRGGQQGQQGTTSTVRYTKEGQAAACSRGRRAPKDVDAGALGPGNLLLSYYSAK